MRLPTLQKARGPIQKLAFAVMRKLMGQVPGPILTLSYRPALFGALISPCFQESLRGPSAWSVGERELFAAFVSRLNQCEY
jgi:hypothetical protein